MRLCGKDELATSSGFSGTSPRNQSPTMLSFSSLSLSVPLSLVAIPPLKHTIIRISLCVCVCLRDPPAMVRCMADRCAR